MRAQRGVATVVFSFLPQQTADLNGGIWKVERWSEPRVLSVDAAAVRAELLRAAYAWQQSGRDGGLTEDLRENAELTIVSPSEEGGVSVEAFPKAFRCFICGRIRDSNDVVCNCGGFDWRQLPFVSYHECGFSDTPWIPLCKTHREVALRKVPRAAATSELDFRCPVCDRNTTGGGFPFVKCECGKGTLKYTVHRAAVVYTPRTTVVVNPPTAQVAMAFQAESARDAVLAWVLGGMKSDGPLDGQRTIASVVATLVSQGIPESVAKMMADLGAEKASEAISSEVHQLPELEHDQWRQAVDGALQLAYATARGRIRLPDLSASGSGAMGARYGLSYPEAVSDAGLAGVELLPDFPVLDVAYGYTRDAGAPGESTLRPFRDRKGGLRLHGQLAHTEALLFHLDAARVGAWLRSRSLIASDAVAPGDVREAILKGATIPRPGETPDEPTAGSEMLSLVHTYSHRVLRRASAFCGIDRDSLSEYLIPHHLAFIIYATTRGDFVLGGLQALFENDLDMMLRDFVEGERRCALDPTCSTHGAACVACLHVGEPSCRHFNAYLTREALFGVNGFLAS